LSKTKNIVSKFSYDFEGCPDIVPSVMVTCAALGITGIFKNIGHLAFKESNRIKALTQELKKIGATLIKEKNKYILTPNNSNVESLLVGSDNNLSFSTYGDHRIAMSLAPLVLKYNQIEICNSDVVKNHTLSFGMYFKKLKFATLNSDNKKSINCYVES